MNGRCLIVADPTADRGLVEQLGRSCDAVIALTGEEALRFDGSGQRVLSVTGLIGYRRACELADRALECRDRFLRDVCAGATLDGTDWPAVFAGDQELHYFRELLLAHELVRALDKRGIESLRWLGGRSFANLGRGRHFLALLRSLAVPPLKIQELGSPSLRARLARAGDALWRRTRRIAELSRPSREPGACRVVAVFSTSQWERFSNTLIALREALGGQLQIWYLGRVERRLRAWARRHAMQVRACPYPGRVDFDVREFFGRYSAESHLWDVLSPLVGWPDDSNRGVPDRFRQLLAYSLPRAAQWGRALARQLRAARPEWVIGSAAFTYLGALPFHVARGLAISTIALSHTYSSGDHSPVAADYLVCRDRFERRSFRRSFPDEARVLYSRDTWSPTTGAGTRPASPRRPQRAVVGMFTASPNIGALALPLVDPERYNETLRTLLQPPEDLADLIFAFKWHPRFDLSSTVRSLKRARNVRLVPAREPASELASRAWVNVVFNHYGSIAVELLQCGRPVIFLDSAQYYFPNVETAAFEGGEVVTELESYWALLRRLKESEDLYRRLADRARAFCARELEGPAAGLIEQLDRLGGKGVVVA